MNEYYNVLRSVNLFKNIDMEELASLLTCLDAKIEKVKKDGIILLAGDAPKYVGIVLTGQLHIIQEDLNGSSSLLSVIEPGEIFAEALCCAGILESPVTVIANAHSVIMMLSFSRILHTCPSSCSFHTKLIENMLGIISNKNLMLQNRIEIISIKSIRAKVMRYLESLVLKQSKNITIPFNREKLADFLCVDRSALSHELARMKKDGLIEYKKNVFKIKMSSN
ncbi:MAG: Crp/Fnr family transcriptional regulator [Oscillospiraceae bacterium]|nr:Crp/Fnr family transcriptional regulator [Oscillospiraceae bacterium]